MVDESRDVAADHRVAHPAPIHREAPDLAALQVDFLALAALLVIDELAVVSDNPPVLVDRFEREHAESVQLRLPALYLGELGLARHWQTG